MSENELGATTARGLEQAATDNQSAAGADQLFQFIRTRTQELETAGMSKRRALGTAMMEYRIALWPLEWGNELRVVIYGDFQPPQADLHFSDLGIVVEAGAVKWPLVGPPTSVVNARVMVSEKSVAGLVDAGARIDILLGVFAVAAWGNAGTGWWCRVTHGAITGVLPEFEQDGLEKAIKAVEHLQPKVRRKITSALHWIREPRQMAMQGYRSDVLRVYAGYWSAFECLVEAMCILRPPPKLGKKKKQEMIDQFLADRSGKLDPDSISECYHKVVNPGFVAKATHALRQCFPDRAEGYIIECFTTKPEKDRLYDIRNAINHGDIQAENLEELIRVEAKQARLWMIVFGMLGQIIPIPRPLDINPN
jgi:hypothetical protein